MRQPVGASVSLFNSRDGQWQAEIVEAGKRKGLLLCKKQTKALQMPPDLWFMFAPIKKSRTDFIVEKAAEDSALHRFLDRRVGEEDRRILSTELERGPQHPLGCASCDEWEGEDELEEEEDDDEMAVEEAPTSGGQPGQQRGAPPPWASDPEVRVRPLPSRRHCAGHYARVRARR